MIWLLSVAEAELVRETREKEFLSTSTHFEELFLRSFSNATTYAFTRQEASKESFERDVKETESVYSRLCSLSDGTPEEARALEKLKSAEQMLFRQLRGLIDTAGDGENPITVMKIPGMRQQIQSLVRHFNQVGEDLREQHRKRNAQNPHTSKNTRDAIKGILFIALMTTLGLSAVSLWIFFTSISKRVKIVMDNAVLVASRSPLLPPLGGKDEIAKLDQVVHTMAKALEEASSKERALIDNAVDVISSIDLSNRFTEVNPAAEKLLGYGSDELIGRRVADVIHEADRPKTLAVFEQCAASSMDAELENRVKRKDGEFLYCLWSLKWVADKKSFFCVVHDINDRKVTEDLIKDSESRLRMMVECLPVALFLSSPDGIIETANIRAEQMYGYTDNDLVGVPVAKLFSPEKGQTDTGLVRGLNQKLIGKIFEKEAMRKDGTIFPAEISVNSYTFGESRKLLTVALDVSEHHEIEHFKQELIAMVSHDLRSPLTSVQGLLHMLDEGVYGDLNDRGLQSVKRSQTDLDRLLSMIDELLDIEKMQAGKLHLNFEVVDLHSVMAHSVNAINHLASKKAITINLPNNSLEAFGDSAKLVQVVVNLLSNAIKFSPEGGAISITYSENDESVEVRIRDEGRGIPESHIESIFNKFQQVEVADHKEKGGKGLGLSICQSIVAGHGGSIGAENNQGPGSTFWFKIPQPQ